MIRCKCGYEMSMGKPSPWPVAEGEVSSHVDVGFSCHRCGWVFIERAERYETFDHVIRQVLKAHALRMDVEQASG